MRFELFIAMRYLRARRKQVLISFITLVSIMGIAVGCAALIFILSMYTGMSQDLQRKLLGATAHITVLPAGSRAIPDAAGVAARCREVPGVRHAVPAVYVHAMAGSGASATGMVLKGVDPSTEKALTLSFVHLRSGRFEDLSGGRKILLGVESSRRLGVGPGDPLTVIVPKGGLSPLGVMPKITRFHVAGVFETGLFDFDNTWAYVDIGQARRLEGIGDDAADAVELRVEDIYHVGELRSALKAKLGKGVDTTDWIETNRPLFAALKLEKWGMFLAIGLIVLVAALNIVTTLVMMVMEKSRDIAILRALGARKRQIMAVFIHQGLLIGAVGTVLGTALGVGVSWLCDRYRLISLDAQVYAIPWLPFQTRFLDVALVAASAMAISFAATIIPSRQAASIDPVEAIRYE